LRLRARVARAIHWRMSELKRTPLHPLHTELGGRMVPFAGWEMPVQYSGILEEHRAVREAAGLFDVSHMGEVMVEGADALRFLNYLVTNDVTRLSPGRAIYTVMCYETGGVVDDIIIHMEAPDRFFICVNASNTEKDVEWMQDKAVGFDCTVRDVSADYAQLALQGPAAHAILARLPGGEALGALKRFHFVRTRIDGVDCLLSRTGYTGEDGCEIYLAPTAATAFARRLLAAGEDLGLKPAGLGARDSLRLEAGFPLYGHEISADIGPLEAGLGWVVKLDKGCDFIGRDALLAQREATPPNTVVFFRINDRRIAREGTELLAGDDARVVGRVLSGTLSPILNQAIGSALIERAALSASDLRVNLRGREFPLDVAKPPLHKP